MNGFQMPQYFSTLPFPLLRLFNSQSKDAFKDEDDNGDREVPKPRIILDGDDTIDGNHSMG